MTEEQLDLRAGANLIIHHMRRQWLPLGGAMVAALVWTGARLSIPLLIGETIDRAIDEHPPAHRGDHRSGHRRG
jgi:hypothetical protein